MKLSPSGKEPCDILITGGTGFIGVALCDALLARGHRLTVLTRNAQRGAELLGSRIRLVEDLAPLQASRFDALINLAGEPLGAGRWNEKRKALFRDSRLATSRRLLAHFRQVGTAPEVVINGSGISYYGDCGDRSVTEADAPGTGYAAQLCQDWEAVAREFAAAGSRVCLLRTGIVLGSDGGALGQMLLPFRLGLGGPMGGGNQYMSWIHRDDLLGIIELCLNDSDLSGPVNGTAPHPVRNREFARALGRALRRPAVLPMPAFALRLLVGEMADELLLVGQQVLPEAALSRGYQFDYPELDGALENVLRDL